MKRILLIIAVCIVCSKVNGQTEMSLPTMPPHLFSPGDGETINTLYPLLQWLSPFPNYSNKVHYELGVWEINDSDDPYNAILFQQPKLFLPSLNSTQLLINDKLILLQYDHKYVWQIHAIDPEGKDLGYSETWVFIPKQDSFKEQHSTPKVVVQSHWLTQNETDAGYVIVDTLIKFTYENLASDTNLFVRIRSTEGNSESYSRELNPIHITYGINYLEIPTKDLDLNSGSFYFIDFLNSESKNQGIKIKVLNKQK